MNKAFNLLCKIKEYAPVLEGFIATGWLMDEFLKVTEGVGALFLKVTEISAASSLDEATFTFRSNKISSCSLYTRAVSP